MRLQGHGLPSAKAKRPFPCPLVCQAVTRHNRFSPFPPRCRPLTPWHAHLPTAAFLCPQRPRAVGFHSCKPHRPTFSRACPTSTEKGQAPSCECRPCPHAGACRYCPSPPHCSSNTAASLSSCSIYACSSFSCCSTKFLHISSTILLYCSKVGTLAAMSSVKLGLFVLFCLPLKSPPMLSLFPCPVNNSKKPSFRKVSRKRGLFTL